MIRANILGKGANSCLSTSGRMADGVRAGRYEEPAFCELQASDLGVSSLVLPFSG